MKWSRGTYFLMLILIWICANVLSQAAFIGRFGTPYGKELIVEEIGIIYWFLICVELLIYAFAIKYLKSKNISKKIVFTT